MTTNNKPLVPDWREYLVPVLASISLIIACIIMSSKKYYWNDELFSYYFVTDPSFAKMLAAFYDKINNTPILYFALGWVWDKIFGSEELSLRLFSSLGMCLALAVSWITLRRTYGFWSTSIGTLAVFCTSNIIISQNVEARMYGLFLALCAIAFLLYDQFYRNRQPSSKLLWANALVHVAIVHTHLFGGFYSGAILLSLFLTDRYFRLFRPKLYLSIILSWLSILLYVPAFLNQSDAGKPRTWIPMPDFGDLIDVLNISASPFFNRFFLLLPLAIAVLYLYQISLTRNNQSDLAVKKTDVISYSDISLLIFALVFLATPVFIWLISITIKPIFYDRYMIPGILGWAILFAFIFHSILPALVIDSKTNKRLNFFDNPAGLFSRLLILAALGICLMTPIFLARKFKSPGLTDNLVDQTQYSNLPVVWQIGGSFVQSLHYSPHPDKYYFIQDWEVAVNENSGLFSPQEFKHMDALKRNYPKLFKNVVTTKEFLSKYDRFLVLDYPDHTRKCPLKPVGLKYTVLWEDLQCPQWLEMRILNNEAYKVTFLGNENWFSILLVEKQNGATNMTSSSK